MAVSMRGNGMMGCIGSCSDSFYMGGKRKIKGKGKMVICAAGDPYRTLRIQPDASENEVKKAFRQLALQYHPDVCKGSNCGVQFHQINEAYDIVMNNLRAAEEKEQRQSQDCGDGADEQIYGTCEPEWDLWEEWMGWEGAGIRDYTSHINPYI